MPRNDSLFYFFSEKMRLEAKIFAATNSCPDLHFRVHRYHLGDFERDHLFPHLRQQ
jgi:hypothetical protein